MNSILNSISSGDLLVHLAPRDKPVKEDSIIELLQNSEIEFETNIDFKNEPVIEKPVLEENFEIEFKTNVNPKPELLNSSFVEEILSDPKIELETCPDPENNLKNINTGFGENHDLHYIDKCKRPELKTPLYLQNYLREFVTEEEKAAARHALGLYNKEDIVTMSLLTAIDTTPSSSDWDGFTLKLMRKGDKFFAPITTFKAVLDSYGNTLDTKLIEINSLIVEQQKQLISITKVSNLPTITSLGDVRLFLNGFNNGDNLHQILDDMNQEMLRFEKTGLITT